MARKNKKSGATLCVICNDEEVFSRAFDKCMTCAREFADKMHEEFFATLTFDQRIVFERYKKAREDFTSMIILD
jgi:hypothetical protein